MHLLLLLSIFGFVCSWNGGDIHSAIEENNIEKLSLILSTKEADVNYANPHSSFTPLILAVSKGSKEMVYLLLHQGANPSFVEGDGWSPLLFATSMGNVDISSALVAAGADVFQRNKQGLFPLKAAEERHNMELRGIFQAAADGRRPSLPPFLIYHKVEEPKPDPVQNFNMLMHTIRHHNNVNQVHDMLRQKWAPAIINWHDEFGFTALFLSCRMQLVSVAEHLLSMNADVNIAENDGWTALIQSAFLVRASCHFNPLRVYAYPPLIVCKYTSHLL